MSLLGPDKAFIKSKSKLNDKMREEGTFSLILAENIFLTRKNYPGKRIARYVPLRQIPFPLLRGLLFGNFNMYGCG